jgi:hypothetical protein
MTYLLMSTHHLMPGMLVPEVKNNKLRIKTGWVNVSALRNGDNVIYRLTPSGSSPTRDQRNFMRQAFWSETSADENPPDSEVMIWLRKEFGESLPYDRVKRVV